MTRSKKLLFSTICASVLSLVAPAFGQNPAPVQYDIAATTLADALTSFGVQSKMQISFAPQIVAGKRAADLRGSHEPREALDILLRGTGLTYRLYGTRIIVSAAPRQQSNTAAPARQLAFTSPDVGEEIFVTAQKREEQLQDVPISISVLTGAELGRSTFSGTTEALNTIAGVFAAPAVFGGTTQVSIRGVFASAPAFFGPSPVAYYVDSVPFGFVVSAIQPDTNTYDLQRIEVLRGPQGTLYGASAQAGVVRLITSDPEFDVFSFKTRTSVSHTEQGGFNSRIDAAINVPIVDDSVAARLVVGHESLSGWIDRPTADNTNDSRTTNIRLKTSVRLNENFTATMTGWHYESDMGALALGNTRDFLNKPDNEPVRTNYDLAGLDLNYNAGSLSLRSSTGFISYEKFFVKDFTAALGATLESKFPARTFSQEVYLNFDPSDALAVTAGAAYRKSRDEIDQKFRPFVPPADFVQRAESESFAAFGQASHAISEMIRFSAGLRYFTDEVTQTELVPYSANPAALPINTQDRFTAWTPRAGIEVRAADRMMIYATYAEGFRSGFNQTPDALRTAPALPPARPDKLKTYEIGAKGSFFEGFTFDFATYYNKWNDVQTPITIQLIPGVELYAAATLNGQSASGFGLEGSLAYDVTDRLGFSVNGAWNDLTQDADVVARSATFPSGIAVFPKGTRLNFSPELTLGGEVTYTITEPTELPQVSIVGAANFVSKQFYKRFRGNRIQLTSAPAALYTRVRLETAIDPQWAVSLFVDNIADTKGTPFADGPGLEGGAFARPRTYGAQLEFHY